MGRTVTGSSRFSMPRKRTTG
uniref:Uncharacterized protein n=1 Tax=Arundo donax TaxID=35708 RepID=A0A0A8YWW7_ARUDO